MDDRILFHLDEHVDRAIAKALRSAGIDVTTSNEASLRTKDDKSELDFARLRIELSLLAIRTFCGSPKPDRKTPGH